MKWIELWAAIEVVSAIIGVLGTILIIVLYSLGSRK